MLQPYIESATALSDYYNEKIARIFSFCGAAEMDFQFIGGPRNVNIDLKYDVLCF